MSQNTAPEPEPQPTDPAPPDPAQVAETVAAFESRIQAGEFDSGGFNQAVRQELFPLLGEGALTPDVFHRLVETWALRNHPFDWPLKPYGRMN